MDNNENIYNQKFEFDKNKETASEKKSQEKTEPGHRFGFYPFYMDVLDKVSKTTASSKVSISKNASDEVRYRLFEENVNKEYNDMRAKIAKEIHEDVKKNGLYYSWSDYSTLSLTYSDGVINYATYPFSYFNDDFKGSYTREKSEYLGVTTPRYKNFYKSDVMYFDATYEKLSKAILEKEKKIANLNADLKQAESSYDEVSIIRCIFNSFVGYIKILLQLALALFISLLPTFIFAKIAGIFLSDEMETYATLAISGIISLVLMIIFWIKFDNTHNFSGWFKRPRRRRAFREAKKALNQIPLIENEIESERKSSAYIEASKRNTELREADMALAEQWHRAWYADVYGSTDN